jgi:hypothetical protein
VRPLSSPAAAFGWHRLCIHLRLSPAVLRVRIPCLHCMMPLVLSSALVMSWQQSCCTADVSLIMINLTSGKCTRLCCTALLAGGA